MIIYEHSWIFPCPRVGFKSDRSILRDQRTRMFAGRLQGAVLLLTHYSPFTEPRIFLAASLIHAVATSISIRGTGY